MTDLLLSLVGLWILLGALWIALWPLFNRRSAPPSDTEIAIPV